ncbi:MAG: hypothetical protein K6D02_07025 [Lachnospiraceae bacterium]|nr:hypothetical protein [Lachnospiraceae bacterium]
MKNNLKKSILKRVISLSLAIILTSGNCISNGSLEPMKAEAATTTLGALKYTYSGTSDAESASDATLNKSKYGSKSTGYKFTTGSGKLYACLNGTDKRKLEWSKDLYSYSKKNLKMPAMTAGKKFKWTKNKTPYFEAVFSTKGYKNIKFTAYVGSTKKGPKYYRMTYATGSSSSYSVVPGSVLNLGSSNKTMKKMSETLPSGANNQSTVKVRIEVYTMQSIAGGYLYNDSTSGEAAINYLKVTGTKQTAADTKTTISFKNKKGKAVKKVSLKRKKSSTITVITSPTTAKVSLSKLGKKAKKKVTAKLSGKTLTIKAKKKGKVTLTVKSGSVKKKLKVTVK